MWTADGWYGEARDASEVKAWWYQQTADFLLENYARELLGMSREQIGELLAGFNQKRLDAAPDCATYPELRGMRELIAAQWRGTKDGAGLDDAQAAVMADSQYYLKRYVYAARNAAQCSTIFFPTSDHGPLWGVNLDTSPDEPYGPPEWPAVNEHLLLGGVSSGVYLDEESPEIFPAPVFRLVGRYCRTADEAVELLSRYNHFWGPGNLLVADRGRGVAMIEKSACRIGVRRSPDGFAFITAMTAQHPDMNAFLADRRAASLVHRGLPDPCADTRYWDAQDNRRSIMDRLLDEAREEPTLGGMRAMLQYRGEDGVVCDNGDVLFPGDPPIEHTIRTHIVCLAEARSLWWSRDNERGTPSWQNRREDVAFEDVLLWQ